MTVLLFSMVVLESVVILDACFILWGPVSCVTARYLFPKFDLSTVRGEVIHACLPPCQKFCYKLMN
jgi:hypothetical protein